MKNNKIKVIIKINCNNIISLQLVEYNEVNEEVKNITDEELCLLIEKNLYINKCIANTNRDFNSISYLIERNMSQSECIRFGIAVEKYLCDLILKYSILINLKKKNLKGEKEKDHLFIDYSNKTIYYAELKANINLDTEKSKATYNKCLDIVKNLEEEYEGYKIIWCILGFRYLNYQDIPSNIQKKYIKIKDNLLGINQYLQMLNIDYQFTEEKYKLLLNNIVNKMFN